MLHLILPPIIVVAALVLLVYLFSRRFLEVEKAIAEGALTVEESARSGRFWDGVRRFFLGVLEKMIQKLKIGTLRAYNFFHQWTRTLKEKRQVAPRASLPPVETAAQPAISDDSSAPQMFRRLKESKGMPVAEEVVEGNEDMKPVSQSEIVRPMVSRKMVRPETMVVTREIEKKKTAEKQQMEEILIERIASNPRDMEAYERLGDYYMEQSNLQDAKECYRQVLRLSPVHRLAKIKIRKLERLLEKRNRF